MTILLPAWQSGAELVYQDRGRRLYSGEHEKAIAGT